MTRLKEVCIVSQVVTSLRYGHPASQLSKLLLSLGTFSPRVCHQPLLAAPLSSLVPGLPRGAWFPSQPYFGEKVSLNCQ